MKIAYVLGIVAALSGIVSYLGTAACVDLFGFNPFLRCGTPGRVIMHVLSLVSCVGLLLFFCQGLVLCGSNEHGISQCRRKAARLSRMDFLAIAKWLYAVELFVAAPLSISIFIWHKSFIVHSPWNETPAWCVCMTFFGLGMIAILRVIMLPFVIRRFRDIGLPAWMVVLLFVISFMPKVWWVASLITFMIAVFVEGSRRPKRNGHYSDELEACGCGSNSCEGADVGKNVINDNNGGLFGDVQS